MSEHLSSFERRPSYELGLSKQIILLVKQHLDAASPENKTSIAFTTGEIEPAADTVDEISIDEAIPECVQAIVACNRAQEADCYQRYVLMGNEELADLAVQDLTYHQLAKAEYDALTYPNVTNNSQLSLKLISLYEENTAEPYGQQGVIKITDETIERVIKFGLQDGKLFELKQGYTAAGEGSSLFLNEDKLLAETLRPSFKELHDLVALLKELPPYTL